MNVTPGGQSALLRPWHFPRPPDGVLDLLCGRPRRKKLVDAVSGHFELFHLIGLFLLHDGQDHVGVQLALFRKVPDFDGLGEDCTPSHAQAIKIRDFSEKGKLNPDVILSIMQEEKPNQVEQFKMPRNRIDKFFPAGTPAQKIEDTIVKALEMYRKRERARER